MADFRSKVKVVETRQLIVVLNYSLWSEHDVFMFWIHIFGLHVFEFFTLFHYFSLTNKYHRKIDFLDSACSNEWHGFKLWSVAWY